MTSGIPGKAKAIAAVAWDIDGTLVDSEPLHHRALVEVSRSHGVDLSDLPDQAFRGVHMADVWLALSRRMPAGLDERMWLKDIETHYAMHGHELRAMPHAVETVNALAARGIRQVCVSNSARMIVDANLEALGLTGLMEFSISLDDVSAGKPDPLPEARHRCLPGSCGRRQRDGPAVGARGWTRGCGLLGPRWPCGRC